MAINEARAALAAPGAVEEVTIDMVAEDQLVTIQVRLGSEALAQLFFQELRRDAQEKGSFRLGPAALHSTFVDAEDGSGE